MTLKKLILLALIFTNSSPVLAAWGIDVGTGSFMGERTVAASYQSQNKRHITNFGVGQTSGILGDDVYQLNVQYQYAPFSYQHKDFIWNIISVGVLASRCLCDETFVENSSRYPEKNYYDNTEYRFGLLFETELSWQDWRFYWNWTLLDQIAIVIFNNDRYASNIEQYMAAGFGLRYYF